MSISPDRLEARRRLLVDAAQALIRETGDAGFSMIQLARRAGVSPATPYNLVGSKSELLRLVVLDEFESFLSKQEASAPALPLRGALNAVDLMVRHYAADRGFYAGLYKAALSTSSEIGSLMMVEGHSLWSGMMQAAVNAGEFEDFVDVGPLTDVFLRTITATISSWLVFSWTAERFAWESGYAARLLFASVAVPKVRLRLVQEIRFIQRELAAPRRVEGRLPISGPAAATR